MKLKAILIRVEPRLHTEIKRFAKKNRRSVNAQLLTWFEEILGRRKR